MSTIYIDPDCPTCHGTGKIMGGDEYHDCPGCRLYAVYANEDRAEAAWKALRDSGADELTLLRASGRD